MLMERSQDAPVALEDAPVCCHHWVIEPANGRYSQGECRNCHEVKSFENSIYEGSEPASA